MSSELEPVAASTDLMIGETQTAFTPQQTAMLQHVGVEGANEADLNVFFHQCKRTGLDPFARQIYMIGRPSKNRKTDRWETKQTIQTGIDGYRLIGRRAADRAGDSIKIHPPQWAHPDGGWRDVWIREWGNPVGARLTIERGGEPFTATALFDEYKQTKRDGGLTSMWAQRPAGQIAKCAEAAAWRMAFPQDLSGIYTDAEMGQADNATPAPPSAPKGPGVASLLDPEPEQDAQPMEDMGELTIPQEIRDTAAGIADPGTMADYGEHLKGQGAPAHILAFIEQARKAL